MVLNEDLFQRPLKKSIEDFLVQKERTEERDLEINASLRMEENEKED